MRPAEGVLYRTGEQCTHLCAVVGGLDGGGGGRRGCSRIRTRRWWQRTSRGGG